MPLKVAVYVIEGHRRSNLCGQAMRTGIRAVGDQAELLPVERYRGVEHDACVFYGYIEALQRVMQDFRASARPVVYIDLGYWGRVKNNGHHKIAVNDRHPTAYFQRATHDDSRIMALGVTPKPWRGAGKHILLAGMGAKASVIAEGMRFESFERDAIRQIRAHTDRPIVYRPKPSCERSKPIPGTIFSPPTQPLAQVLSDCHAVVTHHSNVAVDAIVAGIPAFAWQGVAVPMASQNWADIESPAHPDHRQRWINDISYCQWTWTEMATGLPWRHLKDEGMIPW